MFWLKQKVKFGNITTFESGTNLEIKNRATKIYQLVYETEDVCEPGAASWTLAKDERGLWERCLGIHQYLSYK